MGGDGPAPALHEERRLDRDAQPFSWNPLRGTTALRWASQAPRRDHRAFQRRLYQPDPGRRIPIFRLATQILRSDHPGRGDSDPVSKVHSRESSPLGERQAPPQGWVRASTSHNHQRSTPNVETPYGEPRGASLSGSAMTVRSEMTPPAAGFLQGQDRGRRTGEKPQTCPRVIRGTSRGSSPPRETPHGVPRRASLHWGVRMARRLLRPGAGICNGPAVFWTGWTEFATTASFRTPPPTGDRRLAARSSQTPQRRRAQDSFATAN